MITATGWAERGVWSSGEDIIALVEWFLEPIWLSNTCFWLSTMAWILGSGDSVECGVLRRPGVPKNFKCCLYTTKYVQIIYELHEVRDNIMFSQYVCAGPRLFTSQEAITLIIAPLIVSACL